MFFYFTSIFVSLMSILLIVLGDSEFKGAGMVGLFVVLMAVVGRDRNER